MRYCIFRVYYLYLKLFTKNQLINITTTCWLTTLELRLLKSGLLGNTTSQLSITILKPISKAVIFVWL